MKINSFKQITVVKEGWLHERFGDHFAQISTSNTLKLKSSIKDVARVTLGRVPPDIEAMTKKMKVAPMGITDKAFIFGYEEDGSWTQGSIEYDKYLQNYIQDYPDQWKIVKECLGLERSLGRHASGYIVANEPIGDFIPLTKINDVVCTQLTAGAVEASGGIKMDYLVVNSLNDISGAIKIINKRQSVEVPDGLVINGKLVPKARLLHKDGQFLDIWDLPEVQEVFDDVSSGKTETVFQLSTDGAIKWLKEFNQVKSDGKKIIDSIEKMAIFTALDRPGPLEIEIESPDGGTHNALVEYTRRAVGKPPAKMPLVFDQLFPETHGMCIFQEQLQKLFQHLTGCTGAEAEDFRTNISKKNKEKIMKIFPIFMEKATAKIGKEQAQEVWDAVSVWSSYGFNKSHSIAYGATAYACAYLKHFFPLEWWTAVLRNASKEDVNEKFWRHCGHLISLPDLKHSTENFEINENGLIQAPLSLLHGVGEKAHHQVQLYRPYTDIQDFCNKMYRHKEVNATFGVKIKTKKKKQKDAEGNKIVVETQEEVQTKKLGKSSINRGVVYRLIIAGSMDSLFAPDLTLLDKLFEYEKATAAATGEKFVPVKEEYIKIGPLERFQVRKEILPAYSTNLTKLVGELGLSNIKKEDTKISFVHEKHYRNGNIKKTNYRVLGFEGIQRANNLPVLPNDGITFACISYIQSCERFSFGKEGKEAFKAIFDIDGGRIEMVKWPPWEGDLEEWLTEENMNGAVVALLLDKYSADKPIKIKDICILQKPLELK